MVQRKTNPRTQITEVQKSFEAEFYHRLIRDGRDPPRHDPLAPAIRKKVIEEDALGLETIQFQAADSLLPDKRSAALQFEFSENPQQAAEFEDWLDGKLRSDVLESVPRSRVVDGRHYTSEYIRQSSEQGIKHAHRELRREGIDVPEYESFREIFDGGVHKDILESAYIRAYDELDGITSEMGTEMGRVMSDSLAEGVNPRETARRMTERTDVGLARTRRMARTETSRAYSQHTAARYDEAGVQKVDILTSNPCDRCSALADNAPYPIDEAGSLIPARTHPNCVCSLAPVVDSIV